MIDSIIRIAEVPGNAPVKFEVSVSSRDIHTHVEMSRCDKTKIREALRKAADEIEAVLADVGRTPEVTNQA